MLAATNHCRLEGTWALISTEKAPALNQELKNSGRLFFLIC
jgi:hypothetical protein